MLEQDRAARRATGYHLCRVSVVKVRDLGPNLRRVTLAGPEVAKLPYAGPDQRVKLLLNDDPTRLPSTSGPYSIARFTGLMVTSAVRGTSIRTYTIRHHRPDEAELDIDFAVHDEGGPATRWAATVAVGAEAVVYGPACEYRAPDPQAWLLLAGDDTALPAIAAVLESLPAEATGRAFVEVADDADVQELQAPAGVRVDWLVRGDAPAHSSTLLPQAVAGLALPDGPRWVWLAGEAGITTGLRKHLVNDRRVDRAQVRFTGYWKHGRTGGRS